MPLEMSEIKKEYQALLQQLADPELISDWPASNASRSDAGWKKFEGLKKRKETLEKIIEKWGEIDEINNKIEENKTIISAGEDKELVLLAEEEITQLQKRKKFGEKEIAAFEKSSKTSLAPSGREKEPSAAVVEIRAGTGGEEAALFVADLFRAYSKYGQSQSWKERVLDSRSSGLGGVKEIIFELSNGDVYSKMQYEAGVHRVQRIPKTEKSGRVHTSTATVAVLPKPKKTEMKINSQDLKIDFYRASGPGGQYVNKRETAVRITHLPSGLVVTSQTERNQLQNKENAFSILGAKLLEMKERKELEKIGGERRSQIGKAKRAEKIRTYNFPQDRVTDHRIKKTFHNIEAIMEGKLEPILKTLIESQV